VLPIEQTESWFGLYTRPGFASGRLSASRFADSQLRQKIIPGVLLNGFILSIKDKNFEK